LNPVNSAAFELGASGLVGQQRHDRTFRIFDHAKVAAAHAPRAVEYFAA
jgi:hypothetical protein